jgi:hypothetical protein
MSMDFFYPNQILKMPLSSHIKTSPTWTKYIRIRIQSSTFNNILVSRYTWLLLAGFIVFPSTFLTLHTGITGGVKGVIIERAIQHIPLLCIARAYTITGALMICKL